MIRKGNTRRMAAGLGGMLLAATVLTLLWGGTVQGSGVRSMDPMTEASAYSVPLSEFTGVLQERAGYAFSLGHYVGMHHAQNKELEGWQKMVRELSGMGAEGTLASRYHQAGQEKIGYQVATMTLAERRRGEVQEQLGYQVMIAHLVEMNTALRQ
ncbi:MAG: hypothetical protein OEY97_03360 [Nitrospirota bacterium]|nr:hypothetical protein [Nitrospirota bacterium]